MLFWGRDHACNPPYQAPPPSRALSPTVPADDARPEQMFPTVVLITHPSQAVSHSRARSPGHLPAARQWQLLLWICGCKEATGCAIGCLQGPRADCSHRTPRRAGSGNPKSLVGDLPLPSLRDSSLWGGNLFRPRISTGMRPKQKLETSWAKRATVPLGLP